jgi:hypothetical protein
MRATLLSSSWLWRKLRVELPEADFQVVYSAWGMGHETVYVDDEIAERVSNMSLNPVRFVPVFVFPIGRRLGTVEVRVWPWLTMRSFHLIVDGEVLYGEGQRSTARVPPDWIEEVRRRWEATGRVSVEVTGKLAKLTDAKGRIRWADGDVRHAEDGGAGR